MTKETLRLRIFAGPNGSGKSTIIDSVRKYKANGIPVDFGIYINADDIANKLLKGSLSFKPYKIKVNQREFNHLAVNSGLIGKNFTESEFIQFYRHAEHVSASLLT